MMVGSDGTDDMFAMSVVEGVAKIVLPEELGNISGIYTVGEEGSFSVTIIVGSWVVSSATDSPSDTVEPVEEVGIDSVNVGARGIEVTSFSNEVRIVMGKSIEESVSSFSEVRIVVGKAKGDDSISSFNEV